MNLFSLYTLILQVPICFGYAPEERFIFRLDDQSIRQVFFYEECEISAEYHNKGQPQSNTHPEGCIEEDVLSIDIVNEKLANPKVKVTRPGKNMLQVDIKLSRGAANFYAKFAKDVVEYNVICILLNVLKTVHFSNILFSMFYQTIVI